jgi:hypothetical protein
MYKKESLPLFLGVNQYFEARSTKKKQNIILVVPVKLVQPKKQIFVAPDLSA